MILKAITMVVAMVAALSTGAAIFAWVWARSWDFYNERANWVIHWACLTSLISGTLFLLLMAWRLGPWA